VSRFAPQKLSQEETEAIVQQKLKWILDGCLPSRVFLFGSAARGELTDYSDVDFAVLFESEAELKNARKTLFSRPREDDVPHDILLFVEAEFERKGSIGGVCAIIAEEGKLLFERGQYDAVKAGKAL
jgi:predicted nucleotidyltransferase